MQIDGNALRAARREALGEPIRYTLGATEVTFPVELPLTVADLHRQSDAEKWDDERFLRAVYAEVLGDEMWQRLWAERPSLADLIDLWRALLAAYAVDPGESASSPASSATGGESSKPKSSGSTRKTRGSTSPQVASVA